MTDTKVLSVEEMLAAEDVEYAEIKGWNGIIRIGSLSAEEFLEWTEANEGEAKKTAGIRLVVRSLVDAEGRRIGNDKMIGQFKKKSQAIMERIVKEILKLNGLNTKSEKDTKND